LSEAVADSVMVPLLPDSLALTLGGVVSLVALLTKKFTVLDVPTLLDGS
jgi:hypothetical protein